VAQQTGDQEMFVDYTGETPAARREDRRHRSRPQPSSVGPDIAELAHAPADTTADLVADAKRTVIELNDTNREFSNAAKELREFALERFNLPTENIVALVQYRRYGVAYFCLVRETTGPGIVLWDSDRHVKGIALGTRGNKTM